MLVKYFKKIRTALMMMILFTVLTGFIYPVIITGFAQLFFPWQANGSLIIQNGKTIGSALIGQSFSGANYFWGRPSATTPYAYNAESSAGSNFGPSNAEFISLLTTRVSTLKKTASDASALIPVDLVTASASGLDPEISPLAADFQVYRIAKARKISETKIRTLIHNMTQPYTFYVLGEPRINVLRLNLALDALSSSKR